MFLHIIWHVHRKINAKRSHYGSFLARLAKVKLTLLEISKRHLFLHITANQSFTSKNAINNQLISYKTSSDSSVFSYLFIPPPFITFELTLLTFSVPGNAPHCNRNQMPTLKLFSIRTTNIDQNNGSYKPTAKYS